MHQPIGAAPTAAAFWGAATLDPVTTTLVVVLVGSSVWAGRRGPRRPAWQWAALLLGGSVAIYAVDAWPGAEATRFAWVFVLRMLAVLLVAPVLLAVAQPPLLVRHRGRAARVLGHPLVGPIAVPVITALVVFTPLWGQAVAHRPVSWVLDAALLLAGFALATPLARGAYGASSVAMAVVLFVGVAELLADAIPGAALRLDRHVLPAVNVIAAHRGGTQSAADDQHLAGGLLWGMAEMLDLPFLLVVFRQWIRADQREAAALDRVEPAGPDPGPAPATGQQLRERPWWETDAGVFGDHRRRTLQGRNRDR